MPETCQTSAEATTPLIDEEPEFRDLFPSWLRQLVPILEWLPRYDWKDSLSMDLACGATLGCILISQSLAHASLCGVEVIHGPYSCLLPPLVYAFLGTCRQGSVGTGGLVALLTGLQLESIDDIVERTHVCTILCLEVGLILTLMGVLRLSFLVRFLSRPALSGFITGSALLIIKSMIGPMLGLPKSILRKGVIDDVVLNPPNFLQCNPATICLSLFVVIFLMGSKKLKTMIPCAATFLNFKELFVLAASATFCFLCALTFDIEITGKVPSGLPRLAVPFSSSKDMVRAKEQLPGAALVAIVVFISSFASAKKCALKENYQVLATNELLALGLGNIAGACTGSVPTQIGLSRSGLALAMGVKTQLGAGIFVSAIVACIVLLFSPLLYFVPKCALNGIIVSAASHLTEFDEAQKYYRLHDNPRDRHDFYIWCVAFVGTIFLGAFDGILVAVVLSLVIVIYGVAEPDFSVLGRRHAQEADIDVWVNVQRCPHAEQTAGVIVLRVEGPLFYANCERFQEELESMQRQAASKGTPYQTIILEASSISFMDASAVEVLQEVIRSCINRGMNFYIADAYGATRLLLERVLGNELQQKDLGLTIQGCLQLAEAQDAPVSSNKDQASLMRSRPSSTFDLPNLAAPPLPSQKPELRQTKSAPNMSMSKRSR